MIVSIAAAIAGLSLWSALVAFVFGTARNLARHDSLVILSLILPLTAAILSGVFVYRHVARRRKLQALITIVLALLLTFGIYVMAAQLWMYTLSLRPLPIVT